MGRNPGQPLKTYPVSYHDPDVSDAENLAKAAHYLMEAGHTELCDQLIAELLGIFDGVEPNKKLKAPCKTVGQVRYMPEGAIFVEAYGETLAVPAPAYDIADDDGAMDQAARTKRIKSMARSARIGWLPERQAIAAALGQDLNIKFRPAAMLKKIRSVTDAFENTPEDAMGSAGPLLAAKLDKILERNSLAEGFGSSNLRSELYNDARRVRRAAGANLALRYFPEPSAKKAGSVLAHGKRNPDTRLWNIDVRHLLWHGISDSGRSGATDFMTSVEESGQSGIPFAVRYSEAYHAMCNDQGAGSRLIRQMDWQSFRTSDLHRLLEVIRKAVDAAIQVSDLQRMHAAIVNCTDEYLVKTLSGAKMVDPGLDAPADLWLRAAKCRMSEAMGPDFDQGLATLAINALAPVMSRARLDKALSAPLPGPSDPVDACNW